MDNASNAINSFLKRAGDKDTTVDETVAPAVEHETIKKQHEEREQEVVEKEIHQDHYHTTVQPLKHQEVLPTEHDHEQAKTQYREVEHDGNEKAKHEAENQQAKFSNTTDEGVTTEKTTQEPTVTGEHIHHHLHETIQPVIEKETIQKSVTHKTIPIKEKHNEVAENHGVTTAEPISIGDFEKKLGGEATHKKAEYDGAPVVEDKE